MVVNKGTEDMILHNPHINRILTIDRSIAKSKNWLHRIQYECAFLKKLRTVRYDLCIDFEYGQRGAFLSLLSGARHRVGLETPSHWRRWIYHHRVPFPASTHAVEFNMALLDKSIGLKTEDKRLELHTGEEDDRYVDTWMSENGLENGDGLIVCHPGARWWFKQWPEEKFAQLADQLQEEMQLKVIFSGGPGDVAAVQAIADRMTTPCHTIAGQTTPIQLAALIRRAQLFIGNDSGPMHIAAAVDTSVLALFGSTDPAIWQPWTQRKQVIYKAVACSPCDHTGCDMGELNCMRQITVLEVKAAVQTLLRRKNGAIQSGLASSS
jgi:predicted lipopolysaccharide heptosyltransferase III